MKKKKHIAVLLGYGLSGSGSAIYSVDLAESLVAQGMDVSIFCHESRVNKLTTNKALNLKQDKIKYCLSGKQNSFKVYSMFTRQTPVAYNRPELSNTSMLSSYNLEKISIYVKEVKEFIGKIHKENPIDYVVVNHLGLLVPVATILKSELDIPYSVVVHGTFLEYVLSKSNLIKNIISSSLKSTDKVIALNESVKIRLNNCFENRELPIELVPPGVNLNNFMFRSVDQAPIILAESTKKICFVGRISFDKGIHCLLAAAPSVLCDNSYELHIAGDGPDKLFFAKNFKLLAAGQYLKFYEECKCYLLEKRDEKTAKVLLEPLKYFVENVQVTNQIIDPGRVKWLGSLDRAAVSKLYNESKYNILTSLIPEAHPLVICEAMACGIMTVGSDFSGIGYIYDEIAKEVPSLGREHRVRFVMKSYVNSLIKSCRFHNNLGRNNILEKKLINYSRKKYSWDDLSKKLVGDQLFI